ncbi:unnamed protein product [Dicrocoelium dendriticum]|nr:unnamed protein product [Dicrocoelium dendriticum]
MQGVGGMQLHMGKTNLVTKHEVATSNYPNTERRVQSSKRSGNASGLSQRRPWNSSVRVEQSSVYGRKDDRRQKMPVYAANVVHSKSKGYRAWTNNTSVNRDRVANSIHNGSQDSKVSELLDVTSTMALTFESESDKSPSISFSRASIRQRGAKAVVESKPTNHALMEHRKYRCDLQPSTEELKCLVTKVYIWYLKAKGEINRLKDATRESMYSSICNKLDQLQNLLWTSLPEGSVSAGDLDYALRMSTERPAKQETVHCLEGQGISTQLTSNSSCVHGETQREMVIRPAQSPDSLTTTSKALESIREPALSLPLSSCCVDAEHDIQDVGKGDLGYQRGENFKDRNRTSAGPALQVNSSAAMNYRRRTLQPRSNPCVNTNNEVINGAHKSNYNNHYLLTQTASKFERRFNLNDLTCCMECFHPMSPPQDRSVDERSTAKPEHAAKLDLRRVSPGRSNGLLLKSNRGQILRQPGPIKHIVSSLISGTVYTKGYTLICWLTEFEGCVLPWCCSSLVRGLAPHLILPRIMESIRVRRPFEHPTHVEYQRGSKWSQEDEQNLIVKAFLMKGAETQSSQESTRTENNQENTTVDELPSSPLPDPPKDLFRVLGYPDSVVPNTLEFIGASVCTNSSNAVYRRKQRAPYLLWRCANAHKNVCAFQSEVKNDVVNRSS